MALPGLVAAQNLVDVADRERAWDNLGLNISYPLEAFEPEAISYINAVAAADGQPLEHLVAIAINNFIFGCKIDGIWSAIKASCILAGARTLSGALVPLVGAAPTNLGFVSGDYDRKTGILQSGAKKIITNRNNNADPQDSSHFFMRITSQGSIGMVALDGGNNYITRFASNGVGLANRGAVVPVAPNSILPGFSIGTSRSSSNGYSRITALGISFVTETSSAPTDKNTEILVSLGPRANFYSIGESLDLALLDARVTALMNGFAAAIP
jgi:hypothetical protein